MMDNIYVINATNCNTSLGLDHHNQQDNYTHLYATSQFVTGIILYPLVILFGLVGNVISLIVLNNPKMLTSTSVFLTTLATADMIKLLNDTLYVIVSILLRTHPRAGNRMLGYMYPFSHYVFNESVCVSAWLTVSVAVERYLSVCHATKARVFCTVRRARVISVVVFIVMSLVAVPSALRYTRESIINSLDNQTEFKIVPTSLGKNDTFMKGYTWIQNLLRSIIPLIILTIVNTRIIYALRRERVRGKKMTSRNRITLMLIIVIIVFVICVFPDAIMSTIFGYGYVDESNLIKGIREFTDLLLSINSAVNFTIYCLCSHGFRVIFAKTFISRNRENAENTFHMRLQVPTSPLQQSYMTRSKLTCNSPPYINGGQRNNLNIL